MIRPSRLAALGALASLLLTANCAQLPASFDPAPIASSRGVCHAELRSWVVAGRGRHLFLDINCSEPRADLAGVVEFANTAFRDDFDWTLDPLGAPRIAKMAAGARIRPAFGEPDNRLESTYDLTIEQADCLLQDRLFDRAYYILGANSNSAMRAVCEACGLALPDRVLAGAGALGEFPGINHSPGDEIPHNRWTEFGWSPVPSETR